MTRIPSPLNFYLGIDFEYFSMHYREPRLCLTLKSPYHIAVWCGYMLDLEKKGAGRNDLKGGDGTSDKLTATYNSAVLATRKSHDDCLQVHLSYCDHVRRCVASGHVSDGQMRACFETAVNKMHEMHPNSAGTRMLRIYWGECEAFTAGDVDYARKVWDQALKGCKQLEVWENVIALERSVRPGGQARALLKKGCNLLEGTAQEALARVYVDYERREGDLESFMKAVEKYPGDFPTGSAAASNLLVNHIFVLVELSACSGMPCL